MNQKRIDKQIANLIKENFDGLFRYEYAPQGVLISYEKGGLKNEAIFETEGSLNVFDRDDTLMFEKTTKELEKNPDFYAGVIAGLLMGL